MFGCGGECGSENSEAQEFFVFFFFLSPRHKKIIGEMAFSPIWGENWGN